MMIKNLGWLFPLLILTTTPACGSGRSSKATSDDGNHAWHKEQVPAQLEKYETEVFNLLSREPWIVTGKVYFDADFAKSWKKLFDDASLSKDLERRLLSGPATPGMYWALDGSRGFLYSACQAHACSTTSITVYFEPTSSEMGGRLQDKCRISWVGTTNEHIRRLIQDNVPIASDDADRGSDCGRNGTDR